MTRRTTWSCIRRAFYLCSTRSSRTSRSTRRCCSTPQQIASSAQHRARQLCQLYPRCTRSTGALLHLPADEVVKALQQLTRAVARSFEAPYLLVHMHGTQTLELALRCLSNIDEDVLLHACLALYALIQRSPPARILFLRKQGIAELAECLRDYNTDVKATSLRILCLLATESDHARDEMRTEEVLLAILRTIQSYPHEDDVTLPVLDAAFEAVAHIVLSSRTNQDYIRSVSGLEPLAAALEYCAKALPDHTPPPSPTAKAGGAGGTGGRPGGGAGGAGGAGGGGGAGGAGRRRRGRRRRPRDRPRVALVDESRRGGGDVRRAVGRHGRAVAAGDGRGRRPRPPPAVDGELGRCARPHAHRRRHGRQRRQRDRSGWAPSRAGTRAAAAWRAAAPATRGRRRSTFGR